jgi:electron transfer flavoprotein beta subunit
MRIIVPVKQVPDITEVSVNEETSTLIREGVPSTLNPFCEFAVEAAIQLKELHGGETIVLTMGPPQASDALHKALAMGIDRAIHLTDRAFAGADTWATAVTLAEQIKKMTPFDLIICGKQAIDGDTAQVGPELAELLGIPQICYVRHLEIDDDGKYLTAHRETNEGYEVVKVKMPALITAAKGLNIPRLPDILGMGKPIEVVNADMLGIPKEKLGLDGSRTTVRKVFPPKRRKSGIKIESDDSKEAAKQLIEFLIKNGVIKI